MQNETPTSAIFAPSDIGHCAKVMGILNVTPDSFSDGGQFSQIDNALAQAQQMLADGAAIIDIGGESTRPGAKAVDEAQELDRVIPVIEALKQRFDCYVSIDTSKALVMREAVKAGAAMINDVNALQGQNCLSQAAKLDVPVCLMHMQGEPRTMQRNPQYDDVVKDLKRFFNERISQCQQAGIKKHHICLDPGFGFGKTVQQNYRLLNQLHTFDDMGLPLLVGMSRKSMIGQVLNNDIEQRLIGSVSCAVIAAMKGAKIIRVHDVKATFEAIAVASATLNAQ